jgi:hypothetical protein
VVIVRRYQYLNCIESNGMTTDEWSLEGSGRGLFEVLSRNLPGGTEESHDKPKSGVLGEI